MISRGAWILSLWKTGEIRLLSSPSSASMSPILLMRDLRIGAQYAGMDWMRVCRASQASLTSQLPVHNTHLTKLRRLKTPAVGSLRPYALFQCFPPGPLTLMCAGPTMSTPALYKCGVNTIPASVAYPPYDPPMMATLSLSATPQLMAHSTASVRSLCMVPVPHCPLPRFRKRFPNPLEPL